MEQTHKKGEKDERKKERREDGNRGAKRWM